MTEKKENLKDKNMWTIICNYFKNFDTQSLANLIALVAFLWTVGKDMLFGFISLFNPFKSSAVIRFIDNNSKMLLSVSIQNKKQNFLITETPDIEFVSGFRLFNHIFCERKLSNKEYEKNENKNTLNENTSNHMFQYDLGFLDHINLKTHSKIYVRITTIINSDIKPKIFTHSVNKMFKYKINRRNYTEFTEKTLNRFYELTDYNPNKTELQSKIRAENDYCNRRDDE